MDEIIILFIIFATLFIIETKSINLLAYYIGMVIIIAIVISTSTQTNISYISYMLLLVQISALTILFGFIIMLFPKNNTDILIIKKNILNIQNIQDKKNNKNMKSTKKILSLIIFLLFFFKLLTTDIIVYENMNVNNLKDMIINIFFENIFEKNINYYETLINVSSDASTSNFLKKLSGLMYSEPSNIIKFLVITIILLFAIIGLFFLLLPTNL